MMKMIQRFFNHLEFKKSKSNYIIIINIIIIIKINIINNNIINIIVKAFFLILCMFHLQERYNKYLI